MERRINSKKLESDIKKIGSIAGNLLRRTRLTGQFDFGLNARVHVDFDSNEPIPAPPIPKLIEAVISQPELPEANTRQAVIDQGTNQYQKSARTEAELEYEKEEGQRHGLSPREGFTPPEALTEAEIEELRLFGLLPETLNAEESPSPKDDDQ